jgi:two-component system invasion response regulator UvrY
MQPSVLLVEDHSAVREATEQMLRTAGFTVIEGTGDVARARELIRRWRPKVAVVDLRLAGQSGLRLVRLLTREHPDLRVVVFTAVDDPAELREVLDVPAHGLVCKAGSIDELVRAIRAVAAGWRYVDAELERELGRPPKRRLSTREREVLDLLAEGFNAETIGALLNIAPSTVRTHIRNAIGHMGARTRTHAVALALRTGELGGGSG